MEVNRFMNSGKDDQQRALNGLYDAFNSVFSLDDIADAYCKSGKNAALAGAMLYDNLQKKPSQSTNFTTITENLSESGIVNGGFKVLKGKRQPAASMGTVSSVLGKSYWRPKTNGSRIDVIDKPLKLDEKEVPVSEIWGKQSGFAKNDGFDLDVEDFLVKMLGEGFKLDRDTIHQVLGSCGYDIEKSMERLLDLSATALDKSDKLHCQSSKMSSENCSAVEHPLCVERVLQTNALQRPVAQKERSDVEREVLTSLFNIPERSESSSKVTSRVSGQKGSNSFGHLVAEPLSDISPEHNNQTINVQPEIEQDKEDSYKLIRKAVMEYRAMTKEYFKSAVEAFVNGDKDRADKLLEQGLFFQRKARETDEESEQMIFENIDEEAHETMSLDLHDMDPKQALRLLKSHISSLAGIPSLTFLKVIVEREEDTSKGARKRLILKLLEKESINWTEGDSGAIVIRLDEINHKKLGFAKK